MVCKNRITRDSKKELSIQMYSRAADDIAACGDDLLLVAKAIAQSCLLIGSTSDDCREVLTSRAKDFMMLAGIYKSRSRRFENMVKRLKGSLQEEAVLF